MSHEDFSRDYVGMDLNMDYLLERHYNIPHKSLNCDSGPGCDGMLGILEAFLEEGSIFANLSEEDQSRSKNEVTLHFSD